MKIALMTWFHYNNYGTVLQAAALSRVLKSYGHEVDVIDYFPSDHVLTLNDRTQRRGSVRGMLDMNRAARNPVITTTVSGAEFDAFRARNLTFTEHCETLSDLERLNDTYDAFVCGSDRSWLPMNFDPHSFLDFVRDTKRMIAYAPSIVEWESADPLVVEHMKALISRFEHLSVREESGRRYMDEVFAARALELADPVLLIEPDEWDGALQLTSAPGEHRERYMLVMFRNPSRAYQDAAAKLAARLVLPQIIIPIHESDMKQENAIRDAVGPNQFVSLIRNADYICTDSYHGTALALSFQKEFCCFERFTDRRWQFLNERVHYILDAVGLRSRLYNPETSIEQYIQPIDYIPVNYKLDALKLKSREFLKDSLEKVAAHAAMSIPSPAHVLEKNQLCSGCGACMAACEKGAVTVSAMPDGFFRASVNEELCVRCEACRQVCPFERAQGWKSLADGTLLTYCDEDPAMLEGSCAGGAAPRLALLLKQKGYAVAGCALDEKTGGAVHVLVMPQDPDEKLLALKGIKLMSSDMGPFYEQVGSVTEEMPLAIFATPCQIAGARHFFSARGDIIYIEVSCPGIPTTLLRERKYRSALPGRRGEDLLIRSLQSALFFNEACYSCRWRKCSAADIRLGNAGRSGELEARKSSLVVLSEAGWQAVHDLMIAGYWEGLHKADIRSHLDEICTNNPPLPVFYAEVFEELRDEKTTLNRIYKEYVKPARAFAPRDVRGL